VREGVAKLHCSGFEAIERSPRRVTESAAIEEAIQREQDRVLVVAIVFSQMPELHQPVYFDIP
jgi:hypothetical protein